jgi:ubiquitin C-terminal hydrolase
MYFCSTCKKKVNALRRSCVKTLPPHLIINLKRFGFDYDRMQKFKANDVCQFPINLDMFPFTLEGVEGLDRNPKTAYEYELGGILVHSGIAEAGHYYSYIRERLPGGRRGEWFEFNDDQVV